MYSDSYLYLQLSQEPTLLLLLLTHYFSGILFLEMFRSLDFSRGVISFSGKLACTYIVLGLGKIFYVVAIVIYCNSVNFQMCLSRSIAEYKELGGIMEP